MKNLSILAFLIVLGIVVSVHEFGHFAAAKIFGVGVKEFAIGFGPKLISKKIGETDYSIRIVPLGGFVKLAGESNFEEIKDPAKSFSLRSPWVRVAIVGAGPLNNTLLAILIFAFINMIGVPTLTTKIGQVEPNYPAGSAGIQSGDIVKEINNTKVACWDDIPSLINNSGDKTVKIKIKRGDKEFDIFVPVKEITGKDILGDEAKTYVIGILPAEETAIHRQGPLPSFSSAFCYTYFLTKLNFLAIIKLIQGKLAPKECLGGPIAIAQISGAVAKKGLLIFLHFIALISLVLGIMNLLPVLPLDGGHIAINVVELILRHPLNPVLYGILQWIGLILLLILMTYVCTIDIIRIITKQPIIP